MDISFSKSEDPAFDAMLNINSNEQGIFDVLIGEAVKIASIELPELL